MSKLRPSNCDRLFEELIKDIKLIFMLLYLNLDWTIILARRWYQQNTNTTPTAGIGIVLSTPTPTPY